MENEPISPYMRWGIAVLILIAAAIVAAALLFGNRYYILERKDETLVRLDRITGATSLYSYSFGWQPIQKRILYEEPPDSMVSVKIQDKMLDPYNPRVTVRVSNKTSARDITYAQISISGYVNGTEVVSGSAEFFEDNILPGWWGDVTAELRLISGTGSMPSNLELKATVSRVAFKKTRFKKASSK